MNIWDTKEDLYTKYVKFASHSLHVLTEYISPTYMFYLKLQSG